MPKKSRTPRANVLTFPPPNRKTSLAELVRLVDRLPSSHIALILSDQMRAMLQSPVGAFLAPAQLRRWIIMMALINRLIFEAAQIPKDPDFEI